MQSELTELIALLEQVGQSEKAGWVKEIELTMRHDDDGKNNNPNIL